MSDRHQCRRQVTGDRERVVPAQRRTLLHITETGTGGSQLPSASHRAIISPPRRTPTTYHYYCCCCFNCCCSYCYCRFGFCCCFSCCFPTPAKAPSPIRYEASGYSVSNTRHVDCAVQHHRQHTGGWNGATNWRLSIHILKTLLFLKTLKDN